MKKLLAVVAVAAVLAGAGAFYLYSRLGALVKWGVESYGPKVTRTEVRLARVTLSPLSGRGRLRGLFIGNPQGFKSGSAFTLKDVEIEVDLKSLRSDKLIVRRIYVDGPEVTYELAGGGNNLTRIQKNVESFAPPSPKGEAGAKPMKVEIDDFVFKNGKVNLSVAALGGKELSLPLPEIHLKDIGKKPGGATISEACSTLFSAVSSAALQAVAGSGELLKGGAQALQGAAKDLGKTARQKGLKALGGLFKK